jgi:chemotaxis signal transduction protein
MAIYSPLRTRRLAAQQAEATQRMIIFQLRQETCAIPLDRVSKATTFDRLYGDANHAGVTLTTHQGRELVVIDVGAKIFGDPATVFPPLKTLPVATDHNVSHLLMLQREDKQLIGLPIDSPPSIRSIAASAFRPLSDLDSQYSNLHCVSAISIDSSDATAQKLPQPASILLLDATLILKN